MIKKLIENNFKIPVTEFNTLEEFQKQNLSFRCVFLNEREEWKQVKGLVGENV